VPSLSSLLLRFIVLFVTSNLPLDVAVVAFLVIVVECKSVVDLLTASGLDGGHAHIYMAWCVRIGDDDNGNTPMTPQTAAHAHPCRRQIKMAAHKGLMCSTLIGAQ